MTATSAVLRSPRQRRLMMVSGAATSSPTSSLKRGETARWHRWVGRKTVFYYLFNSIQIFLWKVKNHQYIWENWQLDLCEHLFDKKNVILTTEASSACMRHDQSITCSLQKKFSVSVEIPEPEATSPYNQLGLHGHQGLQRHELGSHS